VCGLFGIVYRDRSTLPDEAALKRTAGLLAHRGPDSHGIHRAPGVGLVHTRLSLLDLSSRSDQPLWDATGRHALVYNGEVYNFRELRSRMESAGPPFHTTSDTEVVLRRMLEGDVPRGLGELDGMFAFGLWDAERGELLLARDRFGIKPLYYCETGSAFLFASEVKAFKPWLALEADPISVAAYFVARNEPTRRHSFFRDVRILGAGEMLRLGVNGAVERAPYARLSELVDGEERASLGRLRPEQAVDHVEGLLATAVERQLVADAPVGALCSGGVDSSLILALAARRHSDLAIFHADVVGRLSEHEAAQRLARHLRLELHKVEVTDADHVEHLVDVVWHYEAPFAYHTNSLAFMLVARLVRRSGVKAVLTGEGSDEGFLGYPRTVLRDSLSAYYRTLERLRKTLAAIPRLGSLLFPLSRNPPAAATDLLQRCERSAEQRELRDELAERLGGPLPERELRSLDLLGYHLRTLLHRNDALGMQASIEARFPFLDPALVRAAVNLPYRLKVRASLTGYDWAHPFLVDKWIVRRVADRHLPHALSRRRKLGFPTDALRRLRVAPEFYRDSVLGALLGLGARELAALAREADPATRLNLLLLELWAALFLADRSPETLTAELRRHAGFAPTS